MEPKLSIIFFSWAQKTRIFWAELLVPSRPFSSDFPIHKKKIQVRGVLSDNGVRPRQKAKNYMWASEGTFLMRKKSGFSERKKNFHPFFCDFPNSQRDKNAVWEVNTSAESKVLQKKVSDMDTRKRWKTCWKTWFTDEKRCQLGGTTYADMLLTYPQFSGREIPTVELYYTAFVVNLITTAWW